MNRLKRLREFLHLYAIVGALPNQIFDGDIIDAVPVMNNFNWIVSQINANIPPLIPTLGSQVIFVPTANVTGTANAIALAPSPAITAYAAGQMFRFPAGGTNTGPVTIATSGLAVRALKSPAGAVLTGGELVAGAVYDIVDDGTQYQMLNYTAGTGLLTFTPVLTFGGASAGITYAVQQGQYWKLGNIVFFNLDMTLTNKGASVGQSAIGGLPYNSSVVLGSNFYPAGSVNSVFVDITGGGGGSTIIAVQNPGTKTMNLYSMGVNNVFGISQLGFNNASAVRIAGWYFT